MQVGDRAASIATDDEAKVSQGTVVSRARFVGFDADGRFLIEIDDVQGPVTAISAVSLERSDAGQPVVITFETGSTFRPIIIGLAREREITPRPTADGERVVIRGDKQIELRCGDASIVLTRAGKI